MSLQSPELQAKLAQWKQAAAEGTLSRADMKEIILHLRKDRMAAQSASDASRRKKVKAEVPNADDLLNELLG